MDATTALDRGQTAVLVNDVHGKLHPTRVARIVQPDSVAAISLVIQTARQEGLAVSIAGGRHSMGGQQFGTGTILIDMTAMNRIISFDPVRGEVEAEAGIQWPRLIDGLRAIQADQTEQWGIIQKQTGADRLSLGGALSSNVHGRGLAFRPIIADVVSFTIVGPDGDVRTCSRTENASLFRLVIGGYGLFGVIATVRLRLARRQKVERIVDVLDVEQVMPAFADRIAKGFTYGDFQFSIDSNHHDFLRQGVFSCYRPVDPNTPVPPTQRALSTDDWRKLLYFGHADKRKAVDAYTAHYRATSGQIYWSDTHQLAEYIDDYHAVLDQALGAAAMGSEVITELYVPRERLAAFMADARSDFRANDVNVIYGTVRLIERDDESFLAWAAKSYACIIFNLHVDHTPAGREAASSAFRRLIDLAIGHGGSYYLTYHRFARRDQVESCYPQFVEFLVRQRAHDPEGRFQSDWHRHNCKLFGLGPTGAAS